MALSVALQVTVVYVPVLQQAFGTVGLSAGGLATLYRHRELGVVAQGDRQAVRAAASLTRW